MVVSSIAENKKKAALGLVPNFSLKGISDAIKREDRSVRSDKIRVGYDRRLAASGGIGVYNTDEGSLGNAINMHMAAGRNKSQIQRETKGEVADKFLLYDVLHASASISCAIKLTSSLD